MKEFQTKHLRFILASRQTARLVPGQSNQKGELRPCTVLRIRSCDPDVDDTNFTNFFVLLHFSSATSREVVPKEGAKSMPTVYLK